MRAREERKLIETNILRFGCHVIHVLPRENEDFSPWAYSIGIERWAGAPECLVIGLRHELAHSIINDYCRRVSAGEEMPPGSRQPGFLEGFDCEVRSVPKRKYKGYVGRALAYYGDEPFRLVQLVYPNTKGVWPWGKRADAWFRARQPVLG